VPELAFFAILVVAIALLITERLRPDLVAVLIILALYLTHLLSAEEALAGFGSEPAIVIACMFVLSGAFQYTGLSAILGQWIGRLAGSTVPRMIAVIMPSAALTSAFTHHVAMTAILLPVTMNLARERNVPASKLLIPLALGSSLGTTIVIISAPSFLVASELLRQVDRPGLGVFSIAPLGLCLTLVGTLYMLLVGQFLLPARASDDTGEDRFRLTGYVTELVILPDSPLLGKSLREVDADKAYDLHIVGAARPGEPIGPPAWDRPVGEGDVLLIRTTPDELVAIREAQGLELAPVVRYEQVQDGAAVRADDRDLAEQLVQVIVAPESDLAGRTIGQVDFRRRYGVLVLGLWRKRGLIWQELARTRLREGDVLVLEGDAAALERVANDRAFLMMLPFQSGGRQPRKALLAAGIMAVTVAAAALRWLTLDMAVLAGAVAMVLARCLTARQAYRSVDVRMYVFVAGAIPLGTAMQRSGAADLLSGWLGSVMGGWDERLILAVLFVAVAVVVQFMGSDSATTALFGPLAIALAQGLGHVPEPFIIAVAVAAITATLTPMAHHNLVIYGPGRYRFFDFFRVGAPATALIGAIVVALAPVLWPG